MDRIPTIRMGRGDPMIIMVLVDLMTRMEMESPMILMILMDPAGLMILMGQVGLMIRTVQERQLTHMGQEEMGILMDLAGLTV